MQRVMLVRSAAASAALLLTFGTGAALAAGPSLAGETFAQVGLLQVTRSCDPAGNSTITFAAQGTAAGPFAGTFTETGTLTVGPQNLPQAVPGSLFTVSAGQVLTFNAHFTIDSAAGQVSGDKTVVVGDPGNQAACVVAASALVDLGLGQETCTQVDNATALLQALQYTAAIQTQTGTSNDSGGSTAQLSQFIADCPVSGSRNQTSFQEAFFSTAPADTPGTATGGGMVAFPTGWVTFGLNAKSTGTTFSGSCNVLDRRSGAGTHVRCLDVTSFTEAGNTATIGGDAEVDGVATHYTIVVQDNGEPNAGTDTFSIQTDSGYAAGGLVTDGNIQVS